jgi:predicted nucleic acid-binding protein
MSVTELHAAITFIDTNIWLYAFNDSQDKQKTQQAKRIIRQTPRIGISTQIINEVSYNLLRKFGADEADIGKLVRTFYRKYVIIDFNRDLVLHASTLRSAYKLSFWDSLIVSTALASGARKLYSEDMHDGLLINNQLTITNPFKINTHP